MIPLDKKFNVGLSAVFTVQAQPMKEAPISPFPQASCQPCIGFWARLGAGNLAEHSYLLCTHSPVLRIIPSPPPSDIRPNNGRNFYLPRRTTFTTFLLFLPLSVIPDSLLNTSISILLQNLINHPADSTPSNSTPLNVPLDPNLPKGTYSSYTKPSRCV